MMLACRREDCRSQLLAIYGKLSEVCGVDEKWISDSILHIKNAENLNLDKYLYALVNDRTSFAKSGLRKFLFNNYKI